MNKEEIEKAIHIVASLPYKPWIEINEEEKKAIDIILKEFEEKEKVIDAMANYLYGGTDMSISFNTKEKVRNFFEDKVR